MNNRVARFDRSAQDLNDLQEAFVNRPLPSSADAEKTILGAILIDNNLMLQSIEKNLKVEDFYSPLYRKIYQAMHKLYDKSSPINPIVIGEEIKKDGALESIGGVASIINLTYGLPHFSDTDFLEYINIVKNKAIARSLIKVCSNVMSDALAEDDEVLDVLERAESSIFNLRPTENGIGFSRAGDLVKTSLLKIAELAKKAKNESRLLGIATGFKDLDKKLCGLVKKDLILIGGRPSMGKSSLAIDIALQSTDDDREAVVAVFSLEVSKEANAKRMVSQRAVVDSQRLKTGYLTPSEIEKVNFAAGEINEKKIFVDDTPGLSALEIRARARRLLGEHKRIDLIIVDHLDLITPENKSTDKRLQLADIVKSLKATAKLLDVPVIVLTPLSRKCEDRKPPKPIMSDLAESGAIEYNADVVILIYRPAYYANYKTDKNENLAEIIVAKNRDNPTGTVKLTWLEYATTFKNRAEED